MATTPVHTRSRTHSHTYLSTHPLTHSLPTHTDSNPYDPEWATQFADVCDKSKCSCAIVEQHAVGREFPRFGASVPPGTPPHCAANYYVFEDYANHNPFTKINVTEGVALDECCSMCTARNTETRTECGSYSYIPMDKAAGTGTCTLHSATSQSDFSRSDNATSGYFSGVGLIAAVERAIGDLSDGMGGTWFSTQVREREARTGDGGGGRGGGGGEERRGRSTRSRSRRRRSRRRSRRRCRRRRRGAEWGEEEQKEMEEQKEDEEDDDEEEEEDEEEQKDRSPHFAQPITH
jgi:hypothetical protein